MAGVMLPNVSPSMRALYGDIDTEGNMRRGQLAYDESLRLSAQAAQERAELLAQMAQQQEGARRTSAEWFAREQANKAGDAMPMPAVETDAERRAIYERWLAMERAGQAQNQGSVRNLVDPASGERGLAAEQARRDADYQRRLASNRSYSDADFERAQKDFLSREEQIRNAGRDAQAAVDARARIYDDSVRKAEAERIAREKADYDARTASIRGLMGGVGG